LTKG